MGNLRNVLLALSLSLGVSLLVASPALAQATGQTDLDIWYPDIVILHYFSSVGIQITSSEMGSFLTGYPGGSSIDQGTAMPPPGGFYQDLGMMPWGLMGDPTNAALTLANAWAVRSVAMYGSSYTMLSVYISDNVLNLWSTPSTISITQAWVDSMWGSGSTITFPSQGLSYPVMGNLVLMLDLSNAQNAGPYEDGAFTLVAQNI